MNPHVIPVRGAPVPQSLVVHTSASTAAISGASAVFRGFRPASLPTTTTRDRGRLGLIGAIRQGNLKSPTVATLFLICDALDVRAADIVRRVDAARKRQAGR